MSNKKGFFILAGVGIGLVSGLSPLKADANVVITDAKQDAQAADHKIASAETKLENLFKTDKAKTVSTVKARKVPAVAPVKIPACNIDDITARFDHSQTEVKNIMHDRLDVTFVNTGASACSIQGRPEVTFLRHGKVLDGINLQTPRGFHPGPVIMPVVLAAHHGKATASLHWVSSKTFEHNLCYKPHLIAVNEQQKDIKASFKFRMCGDKQTGVTYGVSNFRTPTDAVKQHHHTAVAAKCAAQPVKK